MNKNLKWTLILASTSGAALVGYGCANQQAISDSNRVPAASEGDEAIALADEMYAAQGVTENYSIEGVNALDKMIRTLKGQYDGKVRELELGDEENEQEAEKIAKGMELTFMKRALAFLETSTKAATPDLKQFYYTMAKRSYYAVLFREKRKEQPEVRAVGVRNAINHFADKISHKLPAGSRFILQNYAFTVPYSSGEAKLDAAQADLEADDLPLGDKGNFHKPADLVGKTNEQISNLDISSQHPAWHTETRRRQIESAPGGGWKRIEDWFERSASQHLSKKSGAVDYKIDSARRVLFLDKIKASATSPKISTKDVYGLEWKLKWGEEVQTEPVGNRIFVKLGAKFVDLVYANGRGANEVVLVLEDPTKANSKNICDPIVTLEAFKSCLLNSTYKFAVGQYVDESGIIGQHPRSAEILAKIPGNSKKKYAANALNGRIFVSFRESMVEANPPKSVLVQGGPAAFSSLGALNDRVARGLMIANFWIGSVDAKDENNRSNIVRGLDGGGAEYIEIQHDVGANLGDFPTWGQLNGVDVGEDFLSTKPGQNAVTAGLTTVKHFFTGPNKLYFKTPVLYYPKAWEHITYADARWMAKKIDSITEAELASIAKETKWPDFMQQLLVRKLVMRRDQISKYLLGKTSPARQPLNLQISYKSKSDIDSLEKKYGIPSGKLADAFKSAIRPVDFRNHVDNILVNDVLQPCESTVLLGVLERELYPTGLTVRLGRSFDHFDGDHGCHFGSPPKPTMLQQLIKNRLLF
jgi:hypothetical protein